MTAMDTDFVLEMLVAPVLEERPWAAFAACLQAPGMTFFPQTKAEAQAALAICAVCPVRDECLRHALETNERFGVWGGTTEQQRREMLRDA